MRAKLLPYYFVFSIILGTCIYVAQKFKVKLPEIIQFYMNDFLIIPIILTTSLYMLRWSKNSKSYTISLWIICYLCILYSVIFEYYLPQFHPRYTGDWIDVILYFASGMVFHFLQNIKNE